MRHIPQMKPHIRRVTIFVAIIAKTVKQLNSLKKTQKYTNKLMISSKTTVIHPKFLPGLGTPHYRHSMKKNTL